MRITGKRATHCHMCGTSHSSIKSARRASGSYYAYCRSCNADRARCHKLGITVQRLAELRDSQKGLCAICESHYGVGYLDHDHDSGQVRDLLCNSCNITLGVIESGRGSLREPFAAYLDKHKALTE